MAGIELDYSDITEIFKENLKIENLVKSIQSIFLNQRYSSKINYKPYFQRNYVWDDEKATYFIESILLGTEIPPLVLFQTKTNNEVIDGRQRYETIERFLNDRLILKEEGLKSLKSLTGKRYSIIDDAIKETFENTRLRILQCSVVNEPTLSEEKEDKIKKEIFRRYNSGITSLQKEEIERAAFINDDITQFFHDQLILDEQLLKNTIDLFLPKSKFKAQKRDKVNILLTRIRTLLTLPLVPIYSYAHGSSKADIIRKYYYNSVIKNDPQEMMDKYKLIINSLRWLQQKLRAKKYFLSESNLFYECVYWVIDIIIMEDKEITEEVINNFTNAILSANDLKIFWENIDLDLDCRTIECIFETTGSHYYKSINNRYKFVSNYFNYVFSIDFTSYLKDSERHKNVMDTNIELNQFMRYKLNKSIPESITIVDIISDMDKSRFLVRPPYQRSEVTNLQKASYLLESIILGIQIPPIFIYKRNDKVKEVIDGQQRLLTLLGFLGKTYIDEDGKKVLSKKDRFKLAKLRILSELKGMNIDNIDNKYIDRILDFPIDVVEITQEQNPDFNEIDLFLRLNTKPYPIKENTFEMWNAYVDKDIIIEVKQIASDFSGKVFRQKDSRMKNEELIISLAYLDYRMSKDQMDINGLLNIYIRYGRISARIMSKEYVTRTLSDVSNSNTAVFLKSVQEVRIFAEKVNSLLKEDPLEISNLFAHKRKGTQCKTDQSFYFLWAMLKRLSLDQIRSRRETVFSSVSEKFTTIQNTPEDCELEDFINSLEVKV